MSTDNNSDREKHRRYGKIPREIWRRPQWLMWDRSSQTPRRPHWHGNFWISWSDPDEWHKADEAAEVAATRDPWGIGYVCAVDNEDHPTGVICVIDIDGAADQDDNLKDWVPSLDPFLAHDCYIEWSPSHQEAGDSGLHIPVAAPDIPEWWTDTERQEADHEGVEVLTNSFCTVTGDQFEDTGSEVVEWGSWINDWLEEAYENLTGEPAPPQAEGDLDQSPDANDQNRDRDHSKDRNRGGRRENRADPDDYPDLKEAHVKDALNHIGYAIEPENALSFEDWMRIAYAVHAWDPTDRGEQVFKEWSSNDANPKWDDHESGRVVDWIWNNADPGENPPEEVSTVEEKDPITVGTLIYYARENGWSLPRSSRRSRKRVDLQVPEFEALANHVDELQRLPKPNDIAKEFETKDGEAYKGARALKGEKHSEIAHVVWQRVGGHLELQPVTGGGILKYDDGVWVEGGEQIIGEAAEHALGRYSANNIVRELKGKVRRTEDAIARADMGVPDGTIALKNGLLNLETFELTDLKPGHKAVRRIPVEYDPDATCPKFVEFVTDMVREEDLEKLQEYVGYCLHHWGQPYKKALLLVGPTDSGKSTFLTVVRSLLGSENVASESLYSLMSTRWGTANLFGKYVNIRNELTPREVKNPQRFKELVGGEDLVDAEFKGQDKFKFVVRQKFLFATNRVPEIQHRDEAFNNRWMFVDFPHTILPNEQDPHLSEKLEQELPGILNWGIKGYQRLVDQEGFSRERPLGEKEALWEEHGGPLNRFKHEMLDITGDPEHFEVKSAIHDEYVTFCDENGDDAITQSTLTRKLNTEAEVSQGQRRVRGDREEVLVGLRFEDPAIRSDTNGGVGGYK